MSNPETLTGTDLIQLARQNPPVAIVDGLLMVGDVGLIHGPEETFKTFAVLQIAESLSLGKPLFDNWAVIKRWRVGIIETEIHPAMMGSRLDRMMPLGASPDYFSGVHFFPEPALKRWRRKSSLQGKFDLIAEWIQSNAIEILIIDTANDFFRGRSNPSEETIAGEFFDRLRNLEVQARIIVRHDRKKRDDDGTGHPNENIRGSAEFKEDPELILHLNRKDKRTNEVILDVGKLRYGSKPEPLRMWFDTSKLRLSPMPPVLVILLEGPHLRQDLLALCEARFNLSQSSTDKMIKDLKPYLEPEQNGHQKKYTIDRGRIEKSEYGKFLGAGGEIHKIV